MGIQKHVVQALVAQSLLGSGPIKLFRPVLTARTEKCKYLLLDHNIHIYNAMTKYRNTTEFSVDTFAEVMASIYLKYRVLAHSWLIIIRDGRGFKLKVSAIKRRALKPKDPLMEKIREHWNEVYAKTYEILNKKLGGCVIAITGVDMAEKDRSYSVFGDEDSTVYHVLMKSLQAPEIEADLIQMRAAHALAQQYPHDLVGVVSMDTDIPMIASAIAAVTGATPPPNLVVFFQTSLLTCNNLSKLYFNFKLYADERQGYLLKELCIKHGSKKGALMFLLDCDNPCSLQKATLNMIATTRDCVAIVKGAAARGIRGPFAELWLNACFLDPFSDIADVSNMSSDANVLLTELYAKAGVKPRSKEEEKCDALLLKAYKGNNVPYNTYGCFKTFQKLKYIPLAATKPSNGAYWTVVLAALAGTDYNLPLHKFGTLQLISAVTGHHLPVEPVVDPSQITAEVLLSVIVEKFTKLTLVAGHIDVWESIAKQLASVLRGWTTPGYFVKLQDAIVTSGKEGGFKLGSDGTIQFDVSADRIGSWKKSISVSWKRDY
ncbi:ORF75-like protein [Bufonid herpesvirus 1]|uniref:ORF75-like protein n=1 Tax=Bufonid herpesvirus 1 TaxID=2282206 RepID=UPI000EB6A06B|nr:ORF75-like protein [Bufonid herpesvirus 1]AXF48557.1 ORF75-like protein [Bufonid herpesvirus 1]